MTMVEVVDVEFRILGPLEVEHAGRELPMSRSKHRTLLAHLLVHARRLLTAEALIDELWADRPPASAGNTLQTYVSQLRQLLELDRVAGAESCVLRTVPGGYVLDVAPDAIDSERFEAALRAGREAFDDGQVGHAADALRNGLSLWRGPALANVKGAAARSEAARLDELRLVAQELRIDAELACGRHDEVVGTSEGLVREHPWRERFVGQLMIALYRCGRQADALDRYRAMRLRLAEELGVSPGDELRDLERRVLQHDPNLEFVRLDTPPEVGSDLVGRTADRADSTAAGGRLRRAVAAVGVLLVFVILPGEPVWQTAGSPSAQATVPEVFNEFDVAIHPGIGYDVDIPPGQRSDWHATNNQRSPDYEFLDLYLTTSASPRHQISGVDVSGSNEFNAIHLVGDDDTPAVCQRLPQSGGGFVATSDLHVGAKVCLRTRDNRWAMLTVTRMPANRADLLFLHVTILRS